MNAHRRILFCIVLAFASIVHAAAPRAFLDRDHATLGDTVTLNIENAGTASPPDLTPLAQDFDVLGTSSSSSVQIVNGSARGSSQLGIALRPKRAGDLAIPPLAIGNARTQALVLHVAPAPSGAHGGPGDDAFLEAALDSPAPYVGQQDVYTLRLFYASGLTGGQLDDPQADGAQLIHLNGDTRYQTQRNGRTYQGVERRYALIPQRVGRIVIHGPGFLGQMLTSGGSDPFAGFFDDGKLVQARADDIALDARAVPAGAGSPWLPAQSVQLQLQGLPANGNVGIGEPFKLTLVVDAIGQPADRLPEPELPPIDGARVYPDRTRDATRDDGHWLHGTRMRSFAIVPNRAGRITIPAIMLNWWDVAHERAEQTRLPAHTLFIGGAAVQTPGRGATPAVPAATASPAAKVESTQPSVAATWRDIALASVALWIIALTAAAWWLSRGGQRTRAGTGGARTANPGQDSAHRWKERALDAARNGDVAGCEHGLLAWARAERHGLRHAGELRDALADPGQRAALERLLRARWQGGDAHAACAAAARAFARGFMWRDGEDAARGAGDGGLPPLYPAGR